ncbi:MAG: aldose epimerase family protein [Marinilabiliaceae bacterium]|jgi:aldose 1-epimerase|nr:aldose epimerase family protein [Marinilabiliaceae bacterium]
MKKSGLLIVTVLFSVLFSACNITEEKEYKMLKENFGEIDGKEVVLLTLLNTNGNTVKLTNYGATVVWIEVPDRDGKLENVTFGYETLDGYLNGDPYFGSIVGRYANRIANGKFEIDGIEYNLAINNGVNSLHGGPGGWHSVVWDYEVIENEDKVPVVKFSYNSPDMEEGYPGNMLIEVEYTWNDSNELVISYNCTTDKKTVLNITNHAYFNLKGAGNGDILDHELQIKASEFTPVNQDLIPLGENIPVEGTPFDFREPHKVGERIGEDYEQLILGLGYDHNFVLDNMEEVDAVVYESTTGRLMEVLTDQPGVQFYCGNFLDGTQIGHGGKAYIHRGGLCLETQHYPDSPNQPAFPSTIVEPGKAFTSKTVYRFSVR